MLCTNPAANWVLTYWCTRTAEELRSVFRAGKAHYWCEAVLVWSSMGFQACRKAELKNCLFIQMHMFKHKVIQQIERYCIIISVRLQSKYLKDIYCPGRHLGVKTLPRRIDGSRRPRQLENSRIKEAKTIVLQSRFPQPVENSAVILALRFRIQRDCVRSYLNSFRTGEIAVGFGFH